MDKGKYVLATKYHDGDPGDPWAVGYYDRMLPDGRHIVVDDDGRPFRATGFRRVNMVTPKYGKWLLSIARDLEKSPPGSVNLWTMLTPLAQSDKN